MQWERLMLPLLVCSGPSCSLMESIFVSDSRSPGPLLPALSRCSSRGSLILRGQGLGLAYKVNFIDPVSPCHAPEVARNRAGLQGIQSVFQILPGERRWDPCLFPSKVHSGQKRIKADSLCPLGHRPPTLCSPAPGFHVLQPSLQQPPPG